MVSPSTGKLVDEWLCAVAVLKDERHRHVAAREHQHQHCKGEKRKNSFDHRNRSHRTRNVDVASESQNHEDDLKGSQSGCKPQCGKSGFCGHFSRVFPALCSAERLPSCGGM